MLTYVADEARFTECLTGRDYPLVQDGDYEALEHAYLAAGAEAGRADHGELRRRHRAGARRTTAAAPVPRCWSSASSGSGRARPASARSDAATLTNTYWKILRLGETEVAPGEGRREPNLILREGDAALHRHGRLQPDQRQLHPRRRTG